MKNIYLILVLPIILLAQTNQSELQKKSNTLSFFVNLNDSQANQTIKSMNTYSIYYDIQTTLAEIELRYQERVKHEFHVGVMGTKLRQSSGWLDGSLDTIASGQYVSFKVNLDHPKICQPNRILYQIDQITSLQKLYGISLDSTLVNHLDTIKNNVIEYNGYKHLPRLSIQLVMPVAFQYFNKEHKKNYLPFPYIDHMGFGIGIDYNDIATLTLGVTLAGEPFLGLSVDVSTPIYSYGSNALGYLRTYFSLNSPRN